MNSIRVAASLLGLLLAGSASAQSIFGSGWAQGRSQPRTFGVAIHRYQQEQPYKLTSLTLSVPGIPAGAPDLPIDSDATETSIKADAWLLPFLNVFAVVGKVEGSTVVNTVGSGFPVPPSLTFDYEGNVFVGGATLAGGNEKYFGTLTLNYSTTDLDITTSSVEAFAAQPRVGMRLGRFSPWVGAMYQQAEEHHEGQTTVPGLGPLTFKVDMESREPWNFLAGTSIQLSERFELVVEGGFGDRTAFLAELGFRF